MSNATTPVPMTAIKTTGRKSDYAATSAWNVHVTISAGRTVRAFRFLAEGARVLDAAEELRRKYPRASRIYVRDACACAWTWVPA